jgi:glycosyltransferase involved in cell wall biosynthesis
MRIVILYQYFGTPGGSWSTRCYELARRWVRMGDEVTVITSPYDKSDIKPQGYIHRTEIEGIRLVVINSGDSNTLPLPTRMFRAMRFAISASYQAATIPSDIVIASSGPITIGIPALIAKWVRGRRFVFEVRDLWPQGAIENRLIRGRLMERLSYGFEGLCYRNAELVVAASIGMEESIRRRHPRTRTLVIPNASDTELFGNGPDLEFPAFINNGKKTFLYTGSLGLMDAVGDVIEGFAALDDLSDIQLVIIGEGAERRMLQQRVRALGLEGKIHFIGLIPKFQVAGWYKIAHASFVVFKDYPVWATVSPNKMFDSFAAGVPIIQNTGGWIRDLVEEQACGLNARMGDPHSMAECIRRMSTDDTLRMRLGRNAKRLAETAFNRDILSREYREGLLSLTREAEADNRMDASARGGRSTGTVTQTSDRA